MSRKHIFVDNKELVLFIKGKKSYKTVNLVYNQITKIIYAKYQIRKYIFFKKQTDCIKIYTNISHEPFVFSREEERKYFDEYLEELHSFATSNQISLIDKR